MNTSELCSVLSQTLPCSRAKVWFVLSFDQLQKLQITTFPSAIIFNSQSLPKKTGHWLGLYCKSPSVNYFFDSYARPPEFYKLKVKVTDWNRTIRQRNGTSTCGLHTLMVIILLARGYPFRHILKKYSKDKKRNEVVVLEFFRKLRPCKGIKPADPRKEQTCVPFQEVMDSSTSD